MVGRSLRGAISFARRERARGDAPTTSGRVGDEGTVVGRNRRESRTSSRAYDPLGEVVDPERLVLRDDRDLCRSFGCGEPFVSTLLSRSTAKLTIALGKVPPLERILVVPLLDSERPKRRHRWHREDPHSILLILPIRNLKRDLPLPRNVRRPELPPLPLIPAPLLAQRPPLGPIPRLRDPRMPSERLLLLLLKLCSPLLGRLRRRSPPRRRRRRSVRLLLLLGELHLRRRSELLDRGLELLDRLLVLLQDGLDDGGDDLAFRAGSLARDEQVGLRHGADWCEGGRRRLVGEGTTDLEARDEVVGAVVGFASAGRGERGEFGGVEDEGRDVAFGGASPELKAVGRPASEVSLLRGREEVGERTRTGLARRDQRLRRGRGTVGSGWSPKRRCCCAPRGRAWRRG